MLRALVDFRGREIGQLVVPGMKAGVTARDRVVLVSPVVIIVRQLVQCGRAHDVVLVRIRDQTLVRDVRLSARCRLSIRCDCAANQNCTEKK